ncbi:MAG: hypothetical protein JNL61_06375, partial [Rhizobiaceae bacterium]|nr:hypothetical protein [Rhizobiaceae bacterium]
VETGCFSIHALGEGWQTHSDVAIVGLGDVYGVYAARGPLRRIASGMLGIADFIVTGTTWRYLATSWRYLFFVLYPLFVTAALIVAAAAGGVAAAAFWGPAVGWGVALLLLAGLTGLLLAAEGWMHFLLVMDDWTFARDLAREGQPEVASMLASIAADAARLARESNADETVVAAHSIGAVMAAEALAAALRDGRAVAPVGLLTVGSSLLKVGLHPAARRLRACVKDIAASRVPWLDVQAHTDVLNFYGAHPAKLLADGEAGGCRTMKIRFRYQLSPERYRVIRRNLFRVHRQFVYGVERRAEYAYHAILCGPEPFAEIVRNGGVAAEWPAPAGETIVP